MSQPIWKFLANLGDVNPLEHGGLFVYVDETGKYDPMMERLEMGDEDAEEGDERYTVHRVELERCTLTVDDDEKEGRRVILSDNPFHPLFAAWFAKHLPSVASAVGSTVEQLQAELCSEDTLERANAYRAIYDVEGWNNGDEYPLTLTREEAEKRYAEDVAS